MKRHFITSDPANNDQEGSNQKGNLDRRTDGNSHGKIHLVPGGDNNSSDVLRSIADDRNQDETNESSANTGSLDEIIDTVNEVIGTESNKEGGDSQDGDSSNGTKSGFHVFNLPAAFVLVLGIEKVAVRSNLENEVQDVEREKNDGSTVRQCEDTLGLLVRTTLVKDGVELEQLVKTFARV